VRLIEDAGLAALVSDVDDEVVGRRREIKAHTTVLEEALERGPVLPAQFGTLAPDDAAVRDRLLRARGEQLRALLAQIDGLVEVRLSGTYEEEAVLAEVVRRRPALGGEAGASTAARMEHGRRIVEAIDEQRRADTAQLVDALSPLAREVQLQPSRGELGVLSVAFLLHRDDLDAFDEAVQAATAPLLQRARLRYVGPLPPASFVALDVGSSWAS
jgi:hypothetical protein